MDSAMWSQHTATPEDTARLGERLAAACDPGTVVALSGDLGAGKTCFAQGVGRGLGVAEEVVSPTFILIAEYEGRLPLLHADVWRLEAAELAGLGLEEALEQHRGVALVEWADRFPEALPADRLEVALRHQPAGRRLEIRATGARSAAVLARWQEAADAR